MDDRVLELTDKVIDRINGELSYQATFVDSGRSDGVHYGTAGQLLTLKTYTDRAIRAWVDNPGSNASLNELRKVAAIAIRALLTEGCPGRVFSSAPTMRRLQG